MIAIKALLSQISIIKVMCTNFQGQKSIQGQIELILSGYFLRYCFDLISFTPVHLYTKSYETLLNARLNWICFLTYDFTDNSRSKNVKALLGLLCILQWQIR